MQLVPETEVEPASCSSQVARHHRSPEWNQAVQHMDVAIDSFEVGAAVQFGPDCEFNEGGKQQQKNTPKNSKT
ncbi:TPA: hypothetical protein R4K21_001732 [Stenotrophomonas maltophilia]|jgi:hypothetical protein|nr:hypothetical protein [Stenotrophomonas maltophilia]HED4875928.1 hypothetical protein [Stenotrophomonas maltophilia]